MRVEGTGRDSMRPGSSRVLGLIGTRGPNVLNDFFVMSTPLSCKGYISKVRVGLGVQTVL